MDSKTEKSICGQEVDINTTGVFSAEDNLRFKEQQNSYIRGANSSDNTWANDTEYT